MYIYIHSTSMYVFINTYKDIRIHPPNTHTYRPLHNNIKLIQHVAVIIHFKPAIHELILGRSCNFILPSR